MKKFYVLLTLLAFSLFSSFTTTDACNYALSNIGFVQSQTENALTENNINKARFFIYKAIKGIQNTATKFNECGCVDAEVSMEESLINLKAAVRSTSLNGTKILLNEALQHITDTYDALEQHDMHDTAFNSKDFAMNNAVEAENKLEGLTTTKTDMQLRIDKALLNYESSLQTVVESVSCSEARNYAIKIYEQCEQQLLKQNLSEGKKYYNLRTKEITAAALQALEGCVEQPSK